MRPRAPADLAFQQLFQIAPVIKAGQASRTDWVRRVPAVLCWRWIIQLRCKSCLNESSDVFSCGVSSVPEGAGCPAFHPAPGSDAQVRVLHARCMAQARSNRPPTPYADARAQGQQSTGSNSLRGTWQPVHDPITGQAPRSIQQRHRSTGGGNILGAKSEGGREYFIQITQLCSSSPIFASRVARSSAF